MLAGAIVYFMEITMLYVAFNTNTTCTHAGMHILSFTFLISNFSFLHLQLWAKLLWFSWYFRGLQKFSHEYFALSIKNK